MTDPVAAQAAAEHVDPQCKMTCSGAQRPARQAIVDLLANTSAGRGVQLVADNEQESCAHPGAPAQPRLIREEPSDNINKMLPDMKFFAWQAETLANGPYYNAFVPNLLVSQAARQPS